MKSFFKTIQYHLYALVIFVAITCGYFAPAIFQGKTIQQGDMIRYVGMSKEVKDYVKTEESKDFPVVAWTGSMFSGMPSYTASVPKAPKNFISFIEDPIKAIDSGGASIVLASLICFYILMCVMKVNFWLALAGSIAYAFASYNIIILGAGHVTKAYVMAYMPLTIAGILLVFKEKWLLGCMLTILGITLSLKNNHIQITFYLAIFCFVLFLAYMVAEMRKKDYIKPLKIAGLFVACIILAVLPTVGSLYANYEMSKESIRGASELTEATTGKDEKISSGLDMDYAFAWSYGKGETLTLLIPNAYGGATKAFDTDSETYKALMGGLRSGRITEQDANTLYSRGLEYWGNQPFTEGPVYFGALVCLLFVLGMFVIKNPLKWWLLGATVFFIFLSWGKNFMFFNEFMFHYLPMYNKFRTVSMALVIPGLIFPIVGIWGLKIILNKEVSKAYLLKSLYWSVGIVGGLCFVLWVMPGVFFDFMSASDKQIMSQYPDWFYNALIADRKALVQHDALRSLIYVLLGAALLFWYAFGKNSAKIAKYVAMGVTVLIFVDLWTVDKRYINYDSFTPQKITSSFKMSNADRFILADKDPSYRVLNLNNPFNEVYTSYYHKSIGGYNAAKLRRYQELIDQKLSGEISMIVNSLQRVQTYEDLENMDVFRYTPMLNMLNMRYIIYTPEQTPIVNPYAYGNGWFVDDLEIVENADEELAAVKSIDPLETAVVDRRFADMVDGFDFTKDDEGSIEMITYEPMRIRYKTSAATDQLAVFSEIYYPYGWEASIDGNPVEHFRADWTLRGMIVPAGEHEVEFKFVPKAYITAARIGSVSSLFILILLVAAIGWGIYQKVTIRKAEKKED